MGLLICESFHWGERFRLRWALQVKQVTWFGESQKGLKASGNSPGLAKAHPLQIAKHNGLAKVH